MEPPNGGWTQPKKSTGSRFEVFNHYNDQFPKTIHTNKQHSVKRRRPELTYTTTSFFNKNNKLSDVVDGPKFVVMKRNENNSGLTLASVSPFLVVKIIENTAGRTKSTKLLRDGSLLIQTTTKKQAEKLYTIKHLSDTIHVQVHEHPTLNQSKGTIFCREILVCSDDEIKEGLKEQNVTDIYRMKKKKPNGELVDTGLFVLTFNLSQLPTHVDAAYNFLEVREYVANPRRCFNCQRFGHGAKFCKQQPGICGNCAGVQHALPSTICEQPTNCPNCKQPHPAWDRKCPVFQREWNIQKIQSQYKISHFEARNKYDQSQPSAQFDPNISFSKVVDPSSAEGHSSEIFKKPNQHHSNNRSESESDSSKSKLHILKSVNNKNKLKLPLNHTTNKTNLTDSFSKSETLNTSSSPSNTQIKNIPHNHDNYASQGAIPKRKPLPSLSLPENNSSLNEKSLYDHTNILSDDSNSNKNKSSDDFLNDDNNVNIDMTIDNLSSDNAT